MNAVQSKQRIDFYNDLTRSARFLFTEYSMAVNDSIVEFVKEQMGDAANRTLENFQWNQRIRDNLYTLIKSSNPTVTAGTAITNKYFSVLPSTFPVPADYDQFISLMCLIDGYTIYARPTSFNEIGPLLQDSFKHPTNELPYYNDNVLGTGMTIWRANSGTFTSATLTYLKYPIDFSLGQESNVISAGGTLTNTLIYYAEETSVYNGATFQIGASITGTGAALTSGSVILSTLTSPIDLPPTVHEEICKRASAKMLLTIQAYDSSAAVNSEAQK